MQKLTVLQIKGSLLTSIVSGISLVGVLYFFPDPNPPDELEIINLSKDKKEVISKESFLPKKYSESENPELEEEKFLNLIVPEKNLDKNKNKTILYNGIYPYLNEKSNRINNYVPSTDDKNYLYKNEKINVSVLSGENKSEIIPNNFSNYQSYNANERYNNIKKIDLDYKINSLVSASVQSVGNLSVDNTTFDDRVRVSPSTMAGIKIGKGKVFKTGFMTGETKLGTIKYMNRAGWNTYLLSDQEFKDSQERRNIFEMHTSIQPTQLIRFQTAIYNTNRAFLNETGNSEGARVSMLLDYKFVILNVKYNYSSDNLFKGIRSPDALVNAKDYAGLGVTVFLDPSKRYSFTIGNNYHNLIAQSKYSETKQIPTISSFSASLRGVAPGNTTFFLNFRNQVSKDTFYSNLGLIRLPITTQIYLDYATALGLEMSF
ncbi:MAG: hypothetical protein KDK36_11620 [Leptospiraceae bacterium]|nr:hypothetical protein [Leptospiraceae bacterium]